MFRVRPANIADAEPIALVHVRSWQSAYLGQVPQAFLDGLSVAGREAVWRDLLAATNWPRTGALVLVEDKRVVGFSHLGPSRDDDALPGVGELTAIYLLAEIWGRGAGRLLMDESVSQLGTAGYEEATLWVLDTNTRARRFYETAGWHADGKVKVEDRGDFALRELRYRLIP